MLLTEKEKNYPTKVEVEVSQAPLATPLKSTKHETNPFGEKSD